MLAAINHIYKGLPLALHRLYQIFDSDLLRAGVNLELVCELIEATAVLGNAFFTYNWLRLFS
jgi:hypothetical protein